MERRNLVLGFFTSSTLNDVQPFIASAAALGPTIDIVLFTAGVDDEVHQACAGLGIRTMEAGPHPTLGYTSQNLRYFAFRQFLQDHGEGYRQVLLTDVVDVLFQGNPFAVVHPGEVAFSIEDTKIEWEAVNEGWIQDLYGVEEVRRIAANYVACAGTTIGTVTGIRTYLDLMCNELETLSSDRAEVNAQGIHNHVVWALAPDWGWVDAEDTVVATVGCTSPDRITIADGVIAVDGRVPPVVHQWDQQAVLRRLVAADARFRLADAPLGQVPVEPPVGPSLAELGAAGPADDCLRVTASAAMARTPFFFETLAALGGARFGGTMTDPAFRSYDGPEFIACRLSDVVILGAAAVLLQNGQIVPDTLHHIPTWPDGSLVRSFVAAHSLCLREALPIVCRAEQGEYCVGFTAAWRNYAHWMQECLPKLFGYCRLRRLIDGLRLVMPVLPEGSFQQQTLALLGIEPSSVMTVEDCQATRFDHAWVLSQADIWTVPPVLRHAAAALVAGVGTDPSSGPSRVYLHRETGMRRVANFPAVRAVVEAAGFEVVVPDRLTVAAQISLMQGARHVIGEHGAGVANVMFCRPGATVLELFNPACVQPAHWSVASASGLAFGYLVGSDLVPGEASDWNADYEVPLDRLQDAIRAMVDPRLSSLAADAAAGATITFTSAHEFEVRGHRLAIAIAGTSVEAGRTLVYKDRGFIDSYAETLPALGARRVFEFGIYQGGSAIFLTALLGLDRFVCVDLSPPVDTFLASLAASGLDRVIRPYFEVSQDDADQIRTILEIEFADFPPDLIIDDASHLYEQSRQSFQIAFPYLEDGGCYIIEDWSWAHWPENQASTHGWSDRPAMSNLILELVLLLPSSDLIDRIEVRQGYVMIWKKASRHRRQLLNIDDSLRLRGRSLGRI